MSIDRVMGMKEFILHQVKQIKELTNKLIHCWHNSYQQQEKLKITEERLKEAQKKYELLVCNIDDVRATCPYEHQCPVKKIKLR